MPPTIDELIRIIKAKHPGVLAAARRRLGPHLTCIVIPAAEVSDRYHVVIADDALRDIARPIIRAAQRDLRCHDGADTVLCVGSSL